MTQAAHPGDILAFDALARSVLDGARAKGLRIVTAESCTGGMIVAALTAVPGSSDVVEGGLVTYANGAKTKLLGVEEDLLAEHGAVSEPVARAMAQGALARTDGTISIAVTGIAGPGGGSEAKPVGLVHFACALAGDATTHQRVLFSDLGRDEVRARTVETALRMLLERLD
jgi:nicotinamide-nucleotide amidase